MQNTFVGFKPFIKGMLLRRWDILLKGLVLSAVCASPLWAGAQVHEAWIARHNSSRDDYDYATALAVDAQGNVYVTGVSWSAETGTEGDYVTVKYDASGNQLWVARYNGPGNEYDEAVALAIDSAGNVYVTGVSERDYATVKYDASGNQLWVARYNGPGNGYDGAVALAIDSAGNVYVTGVSEGRGTNEDYATVKYDVNGNQLWSARYSGVGNGYDEAVALAIDSAGNVYVTGNSEGYAYTIKYSADGERIWDRYYYFTVTALAVDRQGNVYLGGLLSLFSTHPDYWIVKYDTNGNLLWEADYDGPGGAPYMGSPDYLTSIAVDDAGNVYVTGASPGFYDEDEDIFYYDYATVKYDASGNQLWVARYNGPGNGYDRAVALAIDSAGSVYVTGVSEGRGTNGDYATVKYTQISEEPEGDVDGNGCVDDSDLLQVLFAFGNAGANLPEDLNRDNTVDDADLLLVLFNFGSGC